MVICIFPYYYTDSPYFSLALLFNGEWFNSRFIVRGIFGAAFSFSQNEYLPVKEKQYKIFENV